MNRPMLITLATAVLLAALPAPGQQAEKKEGTIFDIDRNKKPVELGWTEVTFGQDEVAMILVSGSERIRLADHPPLWEGQPPAGQTVSLRAQRRATDLLGGQSGAKRAWLSRDQHPQKG